jgi:hypothetical protein
MTAFAALCRRRVHGLRFALRVARPLGGGHEVLLDAMDRKRQLLRG